MSLHYVIQVPCMVNGQRRYPGEVVSAEEIGGGAAGMLGMQYIAAAPLPTSAATADSEPDAPRHGHKPSVARA